MRRGSPAQVGMRAALAAPGPPAQADPLLLTGDWRSRCPASQSSARGSCAAGSMPGTDRGSRFPARIRAGSSTRTRKERSAFLHHEGFPPFCSRSAGPRCRPAPSARRAPGLLLPAPGPGLLGAHRAHSEPRMPFQIWRGWPDSVKGGVGLRR